MDWTDGELVTACRRGRPEGFARLLLAYQDRVFRRAYSFLHSREDALDLTQEVFLRVMQALPRFEEGRPLWPWLRRITTNILDLPLSAVRTYLFRARRCLREKLAPSWEG